MRWQGLIGAWRAAARGLNAASPLADLALRLWVARVFWRAGQVKIASMSSTIFLFQHQYHVPVLSPAAAAYLSTGIELVFPVLLGLGILTRFAAALLFVYNIIAVAAYPALWSTGFSDHKVWGLMLLVTLLHGPGAISVDALAQRWGPALWRRVVPTSSTFDGERRSS